MLVPDRYICRQGFVPRFDERNLLNNTMLFKTFSCRGDGTALNIEAIDMPMRADCGCEKQQVVAIADSGIDSDIVLAKRLCNRFMGERNQIDAAHAASLQWRRTSR